MRRSNVALVVSLIALFVALGSGAALASGLISGKQIVDHSIPEKKLSRSTIKALHGLRGPAGPQGPRGATGLQGPTGATGSQGPGAISINKGGVPPDGIFHFLPTIQLLL
jgi:hypothetical protein